ncbi:MAG TPA: hypothetical protein VG738_06205 [Chitinophagaceae bacterium]|nr:hypothetical protein [Chitinophagaceae bacterium]
MSNEVENNPLMNAGDFPPGMPSPAAAWENMRKKLDDEIPVAGLPPGNLAIYVNNGILYRPFLIGLLMMFATLAGYMTKTPVNNLADGHLKNSPVANAGQHHDDVSLKQENDTVQRVNFNKFSNSIKGSEKRVAAIKKGKIGEYGANSKVTPGISNPVNDTSANMEPLKAGDVHIAAAGTETTKAGGNNNTRISSSNIAGGTDDNKEDEPNIKWQAGLGWQAQLPLNSARHYFAGPNAASQPYRLLLPGVWVSAMADKNLFEIELNPFAATVYKPRLFSSYLTINSSNRPQTTARYVNKLFGVSLLGEYSYNMQGNWWAGAGIQAKVLTTGVETTEVYVNDTQLTSATFDKISDSSWSNIVTFQAMLNAQVFYMAKHWNAGVRAGVYFTPMAKNYGHGKNPLEVDFFFRLRLWQNKRK